MDEKITSILSKIIVAWLFLLTCSQVSQVFLLWDKLISTKEKDCASTDISCEVKDVRLLYSLTCGFCQRQLTDGSLDALEEMGIQLDKIDLTTVNESVPYVPAWRYDNKEEYGYKSIEDLKAMFRCK